MYRSWSQMKEGWTKNLALLFAPNVICWRLTEAIFITLNLTTSAFFLSLRDHQIGALAGVAGVDVGVVLTPAFLAFIVWAMFWMRIRKARFSTFYNLVAIFGLPLFSYLLLTSARLHRKKKIAWKDRSYKSSPTRRLVPTQGPVFLVVTVLSALLFITGLVLLAYSGYLLRHR